MEKDVQDVFIKSLSFDKTHNLLILSDEAGRIFVLDLQSKKVTQIENSAEQDGADQPATAPQSRPEGKEKPRPESDGRSK